VVREVDRVAVYGRMEGTAIYELLGLAEDLPEGPPAWARCYEAALASYRARDWSAAVAGFAEVERLKGEPDAAAQVFIGRAQALQRTPPPTDWTGVSMLDSK
jgi:adenylate cyclase